jgi:hypothetical protein
MMTPLTATSDDVANAIGITCAIIFYAALAVVIWRRGLVQFIRDVANIQQKVMRRIAHGRPPKPKPVTDCYELHKQAALELSLGYPLMPDMQEHLDTCKVYAIKPAARRGEFTVVKRFDRPTPGGVRPW